MMSSTEGNGEELQNAGANDDFRVQKLLALDVGLARIGVATCDVLGITVRPLMVIERKSRNADFEQLAQLVEEEGATGILCGLPLNMDGSEGQQARTTRKWAMRLAYAMRAILGRPIPIIFWDERLSTYAAQQILAEHESRAGRQRFGRETVAEDAAAAAVILRSYLDAHKRGDAADFGRIELPLMNK